ncbi:MAG: hypothetical protein EOP10_19340 [Proteobacteria bacterium]|nr:MAG: hypothetical protein EOP10_19340 [Pseudomonadota bacterium]
MKLPLICIFLISTQLLACIGTEVGNGRSAPTPPKGVGTNAPGGTEEDTDTSSPNPDSGSDPGNEGESPTSPNTQKTTRLFASCGSPFAEGIAGSFQVSPAGDDLTVTVGMVSGSWSIEEGDETAIITPAPATNKPYAVNSTTNDLNPVCASSDTQGSTRTVTFTDGFKTSWTVDAQGKVETIQVYNAAGTVLQSYVRQ